MARPSPARRLAAVVRRWPIACFALFLNVVWIAVAVGTMPPGSFVGPEPRRLIGPTNEQMQAIAAGPPGFHRVSEDFACSGGRDRGVSCIVLPPFAR